MRKDGFIARLAARGKALLGSPVAPDLALGTAVFIFALVVYNATLTPSLSYVSPDGNELATVPHELGLVHSTGYPLYTWVGKLFTYLPVGDVAHRMNLFSAAGAAGCAALLYGIVRLLPAGRTAALAGALIFAFSVTFWSQAVIAEVYTPNAFMITLAILLLLAWARRERSIPPSDDDLRATLWFYAFCLAYGLSLGIHLSNLALAPAFAVFVLLTNWRILARPLTIIFGFGLFALGVFQYVWLPIKASGLNDALMLRNAPDTWDGFYNYTFGAFSQLRFAFPLSALPDRIVLYLQIARDNFGAWGLALAVAGMGAMLWQRTRVYYLLIIIYLLELTFFTQYRAMDIEVFFIPSHLMLAIFIAFAIDRILTYARAFALERQPLGRAAPATLLVLAALPVAVQLQGHWSANDQSDNTGINDFYTQVFRLLPPDSTLIGQGGVFGCDMFYFRLVENLRPDVTMPLLSGPQAPGDALGTADGSVFTTTPVGRQQGPLAAPRDLLPSDSWMIPVLAAPAAGGFGPHGQSLVLYEVSSEPPELIVPDASPQHQVGENLGGLVLEGFDLDTTHVAPGDTIQITLYWRVERAGTVAVTTVLDDSPYRETHNLGFGNLERYVQEVRPLSDGLVVEEYDLVILSSTEPGEHTLRVGVDGLAGAGEFLDLATITVER